MPWWVLSSARTSSEFWPKNEACSCRRSIWAGVNTSFVVYRVGSTFIDAGPPNRWKQVRRFALERRVENLLLTHHHEDHSGRGVGGKSLKSLYDKVRHATRRQQGNIPMVAVIEKVNPITRGWGNYHREGANKGLFSTLDKWIRNRVRAYKRKRWRDRGRWKIFSAEQLSQMGLLSFVFEVLVQGKFFEFSSPVFAAGQAKL